MALLFADNFDFYATGQILDYWTSGSGTIGAYGRNSTNGLRNPSLSKALPAVADTTCIFGAALTFQTISAIVGFQRFCTFTDASTSQFVAGCFDDGRIKVSCGGVDYFSVFALTAGVQYYIDVFAIISNTVGEFAVRVKAPGGTFQTVLSRTGIDTQTSSNTRWDGISVAGAAVDVDDLYVCDGSGSLNNDVLGDMRVNIRRPTTDAVAAGFNAGLTPSTGTDHGALVDETTPNDDTDYNGTTADSVKDTYRLTALASSGGVKGVIAIVRARKTDNGTRTVCPVLRTSGADYDGATVGVPVAYTYVSHVFNAHPGTGLAWTGTQANATDLELGMKAVD